MPRPCYHFQGEELMFECRSFRQHVSSLTCQVVSQTSNVSSPTLICRFANESNCQLDNSQFTTWEGLLMWCTSPSCQIASPAGFNTAFTGPDSVTYQTQAWWWRPWVSVQEYRGNLHCPLHHDSEHCAIPWCCLFFWPAGTAPIFWKEHRAFNPLSSYDGDEFL